MPQNHPLSRSVLSVPHVFLAAFVALAGFTVAEAQHQTTEPVYRVAREAPARPPGQSAATANAAAAAGFDLVQRPGEHPLAPAIRTLDLVLANIDQNVRDYSCTFKKQERIDGDLAEPQTISMKVRHDPFSVYMKFLQPYAGREVLYVAGQRENQMLVLESGWKRIAGKLELDPQGAMAMRGQKHPITDIGIRNLTAKIKAVAEAEAQFLESEVAVNPNMKIGDRPVTLIQVTHPQPRRNFHAHVWRVFLDNELKVPVHYDSYLWPEGAQEAPPLESSYTYGNLKINGGLTPQDFDPENGQIFQ